MGRMTNTKMKIPENNRLAKRTGSREMSVIIIRRQHRQANGFLDDRLEEVCMTEPLE